MSCCSFSELGMLLKWDGSLLFGSFKFYLFIWGGFTLEMGVGWYVYMLRKKKVLLFWSFTTWWWWNFLEQRDPQGRLYILLQEMILWNFILEAACRSMIFVIFIFITRIQVCIQQGKSVSMSVKIKYWDESDKEGKKKSIYGIWIWDKNSLSKVKLLE